MTDALLAVAIPIATLAAGMVCGIRIERRRRDRNLANLFGK